MRLPPRRFLGPRALFVLWFLADASLATADEAFGEFQRNIEHDRAFQREMDAQRAATDAINRPSTFKAPPSQAISAQAWLGALAEQKRRDAEANVTRLRNLEANKLRAAEDEKASRLARQARDAAATAERDAAARPLLAQGIPPSEADIGRLLPVYPSGKYHILSSPEIRETIGNAVRAKTEFDTRFDRTEDYAELEALALRMETGTTAGRYVDYGGPGSKLKLVCLPLSSLRARVRLLERFKTARAATDLATACEQWPDSGRFVTVSEEERKEVIRTWARVAPLAGRGERELAARLADPKQLFLGGNLDLVAPLRSAAYQRSLGVLSKGNLGVEARLAEGGALLSDIEFLASWEAANENWNAVLEWHVRSFEMPGLNITIGAQAAFRARLEERPALIGELSPEQWARLAAARNLAIPGLLEELPRHLNPATQPNELRNVRIARAAQAEDRVAALALAYECRRATDGVRTDPTGLARALFVASAVTPTGAPADQVLAAHRARALDAFLSFTLSTKDRLLAVEEGVAAGVRESIYVSVTMRLGQKPTSAERAELRKILERLGPEPLWAGQVYASSVTNLIGISWLQDPEARDGRSRALTLWRAAAEAGDISSMTALGVTLTDAKSVQAEWDEGHPWLDRAADANSVSACAHKGILVFLGWRGYPSDPAAAVPLLRRGMAVDRSGVPYCLGLALARGAGVPKRDPAEALLFWKAVEGGFRVDAALEIADAHFRGLGTPADGPKAVEIIRPFAESGNPRAQNTFATLVSRNADPAIAPSEALPWWRKAAAQSLFVAARNVYASQMRGVICPKDPAGALRELESFLEGGTPFARFQGGLLLLNEGEFTFIENTRLEEPGRRWIGQAAQAGYAPAQAWLRSHVQIPQP